MKLAILYDEPSRSYVVIGGKRGVEFEEARLRTLLGEALVGSGLKPTDVLAEARRNGAALIDCAQFRPLIEGSHMKRRTPSSQYAKQTDRMIEQVLKGTSPQSIVEKLCEMAPEDVYVKAFLEGDEVVFTDAADVQIADGQNAALDAIKQMYSQIKETAAELGQETLVSKILDGYEGPVQVLYTQMQQAFGKSNSTTYAQYPYLDGPGSQF